MKTAVLGVGNILLGDEGVGVRVAEALREGYVLDGDIEVIDGGTMGLDLLPFIEGKKRLLIVDAVHAGKEPGTLVTMEGADIPKFLGQRLSVHQIGLPEMLSAAALMSILPEEICLIGVQPASIETGLFLSAAVSARFDDLKTAVTSRLREWGMEVRAKRDVATAEG